MSSYTQSDRPLTVTSAVGNDTLLVAGFRGHEAISQLFRFEVDLIAEVTDKIRFDQLVGSTMTIEMRLPAEDKRWFNGLVTRFTQGGRDEKFIRYHAELAPKLWRLSKKIRSRVFQQLSTPDILRAVFTGLDVSYQILGTYYPRVYCVQYRESDFDFASRLMEEEGIYYFFVHTSSGHQMIVTDVANQHPAVAGQTSAIYDEISGGVRNDMRVKGWEKSQELRSGAFTLWDHCFELPGNNLEAKEKTVSNVKIGKVTHKLNLGGNDQLEIYEYPGGYARRFDGINRNGGEQRQDLNHILEDGSRTARIRIEEQEPSSIEVAGKSDCGNFTPGHVFTLERHFDADGKYLLTRVQHEARTGNYRSGQDLAFSYENRFICIPDALPYRPPRLTAKPVIAGIQTATVVGPRGDEIFCDKYGRVKVQFHWDREGKKDQASSCWLRVSQVWAGKGWGSFFWPRIGHEVVVSFEDGNPDQPLIVGSVYNAENMPWFDLPANKELGGFKSASMRGSAHKNFNGIVFNDAKGKEHLSIHSERNLSLNSEGDKMIHSGRHKGERVAVANLLTVGKLLPGGGSGGGEFSEGDPWTHPAPQGLLGINASVTYGDAFQVAIPLNHQLAWGNNFQMCINPFGWAAGFPGITIPDFLQSFLGSGMGGNMQFTVGTSAQFTLGQSYEISIGPPKIEIHADYKEHFPVNLLCGILGGLALVYVILYGAMPTYTPDDKADKAVNQDKEQSGDRLRTVTTLAYQLVVDVMLTAILAVECSIDRLDWLADDTMKTLYQTDQSILTPYLGPDVPDSDAEPGWWEKWGGNVFGGIGVLAALEAEVLIPDTLDS